MKKKELPPKTEDKTITPPTEGASKPKRITKYLNRAFDVAKFILGVLLLPFVYGFTVSFWGEFSTAHRPARDYFWAGIISFLIFHLFIWEPAKIYAKGQKMLEMIFAFFKPLVKVAPYLLPVYAIILFVFYQIASLFMKGWLNYFIFLFGFSMGLHLVFSAKSIRSKQGDFLKANYIFGFSFIYIVNVIFVAMCFNLLFERFSLVGFFNNSFQIGQGITYAVFKQLFIV